MTERPSRHPVDVHVGTAIRTRRRQVHMNQEQMAKALGISPQQVQKYEIGDSRISASRLYDVAEVLKVPTAYFFRDLDEKQFEFFSAGLEANVSDFLKTAEGQELAQIFPQLTDTSLRRKMVDLIRAMITATKKFPET